MAEISEASDFPHTIPVRETTALPTKAIRLQGTPAFDESFRLLALNIDRLLADTERRSIVVLSAMPREGRSTTAAALARALSRMTPLVVLIDADPEGSGPADFVPSWKHEGGDNGRGAAVGPRYVNPWFPAGTPETFVRRVQETAQDALEAGATVIIDAPACSASSAGFYLATEATAVLYVTRPSATRNGDVHGDVRAQLDLLGARVLGVVVNEG
jgi:polysaccharide biosynthesis transport protein